MDTDAALNWFSLVKGTTVDVEIAGRIFGVRRGEAPQVPDYMEIIDDEMIVHFRDKFMTFAYPQRHIERVSRGTEILSIVCPRGFSSSGSGSFIVQDANRVTFGWHYYGRPQTDDNWCTEVYIFDGDEVSLSGTGPLTIPSMTFKRADHPAVRFWSTN